MALLNNKSEQFSIQKYRFLIQVGFFVLTIWIGIEFYIFVDQLEQGIIPTVSRPAGVESFLPISGLISLKYWVLTGIFNTIHPSALVLLLIFIVISLFLKKGFCSWICPIGWFSELLTKLHIKIFSRQLKLPRWLDYPFRSLKYLLLLLAEYSLKTLIMIAVIMYATTMAMNGEVSNGITIFLIMPPTSITPKPPAAIPAPINPPIKTCVSEIGKE